MSLEEINLNSDICALSSPLAGEDEFQRELESVRNSGEGYKIGHRNYAKYIKDFARDMRKNSTPQEIKLWATLKNNKLGSKFRRQFAIDNKYIADFVCLEKRLIIELDGGQHNGCFIDIDRTFYLEQQNFKLIRFWNNEIDKNFDDGMEFWNF
jgi:very-short-patch-repair endonuclease